MASTAEALIKIELQGAGDNPGAWHTPLNNGLSQMVEGFKNLTSISMATASVELTDTQYVSNQARSAGFKLTGTLTANRTVTAPNRKSYYYIHDATTHAGFTLEFLPSGGTGVQLKAGFRYIVYLDGAGGVQILSTSDPEYFDGTGINSITITPTPANVTPYAGMEINVKFASANTSAVYINPGNATYYQIIKDASSALVSGDISANMVGKLVFNGTNFCLFPPKIATTLGLVNGGEKTSGFTAAVNTRYTVNFAADGTITGPASATIDDIIVLALGSISVNHTFAPNGLKINGSTANLVLPPQQTITLVYTGATNGWV